MEKVISMEEYCKSLENRINEIIKDSTYDELSKYIGLLPSSKFIIYDSRFTCSEEKLRTWGIYYINEYYKVIGKLDAMNTDRARELIYKIHLLYLKESHYDIVLNYHEFVTYSRLLNATFSDYKPNKTRKSDKKQFQYMDPDVDSIVYHVNHSPHPHAYEVEMFRLRILVMTLHKRYQELFNQEFSKIDLDDEELKKYLSEDRIQEIKKKIKRK